MNLGAEWASRSRREAWRRCLLHGYTNTLLPLAVHNAVNCSKHTILSSFLIYKYMYELHLTEVLLIDIMKMKLYVDV